MYHLRKRTIQHIDGESKKQSTKRRKLDDISDIFTISTCRRLPDEIWEKILRYLPIGDRLNLECVCRQFARVMPYNDLAIFSPSHFDWPTNRCELFHLKFPQISRPTDWAIVLTRQFLGQLLFVLGFHHRDRTRIRGFVSGFQVTSVKANQRVVCFTDTLGFLLNRWFPFLEHLDLSHSMIKVDAIPSFQYFRGLKTLVLNQIITVEHARRYLRIVSNQELFDAALSVARECRQLTKFEMKHVGQVTCHFSALQFGPTLRELVLGMLLFSDDHLTQLIVSCPNLTRLHLSNLVKVTTLAPLAQLRHLSDLKIHCVALAERFLDEICDGCKNLDYLDVQYESLTDVSPLIGELTNAEALLRLAHPLKRLKFSSSALEICSIDETLLRRLLRTQPEIKTLKLQTRSLTTAILTVVAECLPEVECLKFGHFRLMVGPLSSVSSFDFGLSAENSFLNLKTFFQVCRKLKHLTLYHTDLRLPSYIQQLAWAPPSLEHVDLVECVLRDLEAIQWLGVELLDVPRRSKTLYIRIMSTKYPNEQHLESIPDLFAKELLDFNVDVQCLVRMPSA